jgi:hypothetical protein
MEAIIAQTQEPDNGGGFGRAVYGGMDWRSRITPDTITAASSVLNETQQQALQEMLQQQLRQQQRPAQAAAPNPQ